MESSVLAMNTLPRFSAQVMAITVRTEISNGMYLHILQKAAGIAKRVAEGEAIIRAGFSKWQGCKDRSYISLKPDPSTPR
jgi:hypothetical protein